MSLAVTLQGGFETSGKGSTPSRSMGPHKFPPHLSTCRHLVVLGSTKPSDPCQEPGACAPTKGAAGMHRVPELCLYQASRKVPQE